MGIKYIDVTLTLNDGDPGVSYETARTIAQHGWNARTLHLYSHAGTHMDAPVHFGVPGPTIDQINPERFFTECHLIDIPDIHPGSFIETRDIGSVAEAVTQGQGLIFRTGWHKKYGTPAYREGIPSITPELAEWCVSKGIQLVGVEPPSVADVQNLELVTRVHTILLKGGIIIVEGLGDLSGVSKTPVKLVTLPLKIGMGDGSPCRAIVIEKEDLTQKLEIV